MATVEVKVPDIGDFKDVEIIEVLVKPGDTVKVEQSLVTVESDKASMEIPSSAAGVVKELRVKLGDKISEGSMLLVLEGEGGAAAPAPAPPRAAAAPAAAAASAPAATAAVPASSSRSPVPSSSAGGGTIDVVVPDIGDFDEVAVIEILVKVGDTVKAEQSLITVESDKASMEIPSSHDGVVKALMVKIGDKVAKGSAIATLEGTSGAAAASVSPAAPAPTPSAAAAPSSAPGEKAIPTAALPARMPATPRWESPSR